MPIDSSTDSSTNEYTTLPRHVMDFLKSIDKDETTLVVMDYGKGNFSHRALFSELSEFLVTETHRMKIRVGGNFCRFASGLIFNLLDRKMTNCRRFEFFRISAKDDENTSSEGDNWIQKICEVATVRYMSDYKFDLASDFMRYVDKYDIRGASAMVWDGTLPWGCTGFVPGISRPLMVSPSVTSARSSTFRLV